MAEIFTMRVPIDSPLGKMGIETMNDWCDGHIMQESLDIFRDLWKQLDLLESPIIMIVAICNGHVVGMSGGIIQNGQLNNSIIVVNQKFRRRGIGTKMLRSKAETIASLWPNVNIISRVSQDNAGSIQTCLKAGFRVIEEGNFTKKNGDPASYFIFKYE
jgi:RimJ/RimL family protein N-acetyltransferase